MQRGMFRESSWVTAAAVLFVLASAPAQAPAACSGGPELFVCLQESDYLNKLAELGYTTFQESFEDDLAWGWVRSSVTVINSAPSITSSGVVWTSNHPQTNEITTGAGAARTGLWGVYDPDHGSATGTPAACDIDNPPASCLYHDGFSGTRTPGDGALHGVGGFISGIIGADIAVVLDGTRQIGMGKLNGPDHYFFGVIDAAALGFNRFEFRELEGKVGQEMYIFGDDFTFAAAPAAIRYHVSALNGSDLSGDGSAADPWQNIAYAVSEIDAQTVPATLLITVDTYPESVVIDKPGGLYHLSGGWDEAFQSRSGVSSVDGMLVIRGVSVLVSDLVLQ